MRTVTKLLGTIALLALINPTYAQQGPTEYNLIVSPQDIDLIGQAIQELPAKVANPLSQRLATQIKRQQEEFVKAKGEVGKPVEGTKP